MASVETSMGSSAMIRSASRAGRSSTSSTARASSVTEWLLSVIGVLLGTVGQGRLSVELVLDLDEAVLGTRPAHRQLSQRGELLERDRLLAEELQQGEEASDGGEPVG